MARNDIPKEVKQLQLNYFLTTLLVYIVFFLVSFFFLSIFFTILQVHPYVTLLLAILLLLVDILATDRIANHLYKEKWIRK